MRDKIVDLTLLEVWRSYFFFL